MGADGNFPISRRFVQLGFDTVQAVYDLILRLGIQKGVRRRRAFLEDTVAKMGIACDACLGVNPIGGLEEQGAYRKGRSRFRCEVSVGHVGVYNEDVALAARKLLVDNAVDTISRGDKSDLHEGRGGQTGIDGVGGINRFGYAVFYHQRVARCTSLHFYVIVHKVIFLILSI